ncbi:MAG: PfkB family carbohydrate kinase, partial [Defluviitaleaceae bacterium]|nr:PfkB family carbohydrate kinase [Defluviitaleaceae bacterium]
MDKQKIASRLENLDGSISMFADGFIDEQWSLVGSRASFEEVNILSKMTQFADRINAVGSGGMGIELIKKRVVFGGFTANIGFAAATLGVNTVMAGLFGDGAVEPVFEPLQKISRMITIGKSSITHALEFDDGKILMTDMEAVLGVRWNKIVDALGMDEVIKIITASDIIGVGYWSLMPAFDDIVEQICGIIPQDGKNRRFFYDFADFSRRDEASLVKTLNKLSDLNKKVPMTLSVNEHEGAVIFKLYNEIFDNVGKDMADKTERVRERMGLDELVIHTPHFAAMASQSMGAAVVSQGYVEKPVRTAGAGDTFNGGYIAATLAGLDAAERLYTANAA